MTLCIYQQLKWHNNHRSQNSFGNNFRRFRWLFNIHIKRWMASIWFCIFHLCYFLFKYLVFIHCIKFLLLLNSMIFHNGFSMPCKILFAIEYFLFSILHIYFDSTDQKMRLLFLILLMVYFQLLFTTEYYYENWTINMCIT